MDTKRIRGRVVEIEAGEVADIGCVAVGVVRVGLPHEVGMRFEAKGGDADAACQQLEAEIEAFFS